MLSGIHDFAVTAPEMFKDNINRYWQDEKDEKDERDWI